MKLTYPFPLEDLDIFLSAIAAFLAHDIRILSPQSRHNDILKTVQETLPPFAQRAYVVRADICDRVDGQMALRARFKASY